jgi:hypothetical protein
VVKGPQKDFERSEGDERNRREQRQASEHASRRYHPAWQPGITIRLPRPDAHGLVRMRLSATTGASNPERRILDRPDAGHLGCKPR